MSGSGPDDFSVLLAQLRDFRTGHLAGEPSDRALSRAAGVSPTTVGSWLAGNRFPQDFGKLAAIVRAVAARASSRRIRDPDGVIAVLLDEGTWRAAYRQEAEKRAGHVAEGVQRAQAASILGVAPAGRPLAEVTDPFSFEVHRPVQPTAPPSVLPDLPAYVTRNHDMDLAAMVAAAAEGRSGVAMLVGGSSTGKTRACWEALALLRDRPERWRLWHPIDPSRPEAALRELPSIGPHTVIWLNEAQFYLNVIPGGLGEQVAAGLRELLRSPDKAPVLLLGTLWPEFWDVLTARAPASAEDPHGQARELLAGRDISVPATFTASQLPLLAATEDPRLALAADAEDGRVIQFLAGAPELVSRYRNAPPPAAALINVAMDARRLGMGIALPLAFLQAAAPGYLSDADWDALPEDWLEQALAYTSAPCKGTRGALARTRSRTDADAADSPSPVYRLADYLEQHGRHVRRQHVPPATFWMAAARFASPQSVAALAAAAESLGLLRDAARLRKRATELGDIGQAVALIEDWQRQHPFSPEPVHWAIMRVSLDDPSDVAKLLNALKNWIGRLVFAVLARRPTVVRLDDPEGVSELGTLDRAVDGELNAALLARNPPVHVRLDDPDGVSELGALVLADAGEQVAALLARNPAACVRLDDPKGVAELLNALRRAGDQEQVAALVARNPGAHAHLDNPGGIARLIGALQEAGAEGDACVLARRAAEHAPAGKASGTDQLLSAMWSAGAREHASALARFAAEHVPLDDLIHVAGLLGTLRKAGAGEQVSVLARRAAAKACLDDPEGVVYLLDALQEAGEQEQVAVLLTRDPGAHVELDYHPDAVAWLIDRLKAAGAESQATALLYRAIDSVRLDGERGLQWLENALQKSGEQEQVTLLAWRVVSRVSHDDPLAIAQALDILRQAGAEEQAAALIARDPATTVCLGNASGVARLLNALRHTGAEEQAAALIARDPATAVHLEDFSGIAELLMALREAGAEEQAAALIARDPATTTPLNDADLFDWLLEALTKIGAQEQLRTFVNRLPAEGHFSYFREVVAGAQTRYRFGREPDGSPALPWGWSDLE